MVPDEIDAAAGVLAAAFVDEPIFVAALPARTARERLCPPLFAANLRHALRFGEVLVAADGGAVVGAGYWAPRPEPALAAADGAALGFTALGAEWGDALTRLGGIEAEAARTLNTLPEPWRYLGSIGITPERQGQGLGSLLLRRLLGDAAAAGQPVGLITDRAENLPFYRRAGFDLVAEGAAADGKLRWWSFAALPAVTKA
jgi:GNAT superfamily N-acetyltransferase